VEQQTNFLEVGGGRIAYNESGTGPLVVLSPGMGDLRSSYRALAPALVSAGHRVVSADLRGHGDSDTTFTSYGDVDTSRDLRTLIEYLGGPAVIVGNSMSAGAAVVVAASRPELVSGLVLVGPFVRDPKVSAVNRALLAVTMTKPLAAVTWSAYLAKLFAGTRPADFDNYRKSVITAMRRPGYAASFIATTKTSHAAAEEQLGRVSAPSIVIMGALDPDFDDPEGEARWIANQLHSTLLMVPDAGHYPHAQQPGLVNESIVSFLNDKVRHA
jgi:pimeloyl-ACP methyl ester carboxylesterase